MDTRTVMSLPCFKCLMETVFTVDATSWAHGT